MELIIPQNDRSFHQFAQFAYETVNSQHMPSCEDLESNLPYILRFWKSAKSEYLYKLMGEQLILSKPIEYRREEQDTLADMQEMINTHRTFIYRLTDKLMNVFGISNIYDNRFGECIRAMLNANNLIEGRVPFDVCANIMGKEINLVEGQKSMRALGRLAKIFDIEQEFEEFRIAHSMVLNQKTIKGNLNLSIHPLDYATASDNDSGWSSCMSWREGGCYRLGTVEMMNSPMVICAYVSSEHSNMEIADEDWPSKKWRAWIIVNKDIIIVNKHYPYHNQVIAAECVEWVRDLAERNLGWRYLATKRDRDWSDDGWTFLTNYMYNDFDAENEFTGAMSADLNFDSDSAPQINYSGVAECMCCGQVIEADAGCDEGANTLCCDDCCDVVYCVQCGTPLSEEADGVYYSANGDGPYCEYCYNEQYGLCNHCDEECHQDDLLTIGFPMDQVTYLKTMQNRDASSYSIFRNDPIVIQEVICTDCLRKMGLHKGDFFRGIDFKCNYSGEQDSNITWVDFMPDPAKVTFDQFMELMSPSNDVEHHKEALFELWSKYITKLNEQGFISF